jgi:YD repeat-containing protein
VTKTYAYGLQRISENQLIGGVWTPSFYGYDGHGNVRYLTNAAGTITDTYTYDAFGLLTATTGSTPNAYTYSGERFDQNTPLASWGTRKNTSPRFVSGHGFQRCHHPRRKRERAHRAQLP